MKQLTVTLFSILFISCKPASRNNQIAKIEIALSSGWEDGRRAISIDTSLKYIYFGDGVNKKIYFKKGYFEGRISEGFWDTLNNRFIKEKVVILKNDSDKIIQDASNIELVIHWKNDKVQKLSFNGDFPNDTLRANLIWLLESCKTVRLYPTKPFKYETTVQNPLPVIVQPGRFFLPPSGRNEK
jgi:hypothetical protein